METCYACENPATGREHVPAKCLFPKQEAYRKNLITVPSCDDHNSNKSADDEYLRHLILCSPIINELALEIADASLIPSLERRPHLMETFLPNLRPVRMGSLETGAFTVDISRMEAAMRSITQGLVFNETGKKLTCKTHVVWGVLMTPDLKSAPLFEIMRSCEQHLAGQPPKGENPRVFRYTLKVLNEGRDGICRMQFFEGHPFYVLWGGKERAGE